MFAKQQDIPPTIDGSLVVPGHHWAAIGARPGYESGVFPAGYLRPNNIVQPFVLHDGLGYNEAQARGLNRALDVDVFRPMFPSHVVGLAL